MSMVQRVLAVYVLVASCVAAEAQDSRVITPDAFKDPAPVFRPITTLGVGETNSLSDHEIDRLGRAFQERGFGGVMVAPTTPPPPRGTSEGLSLSRLKHSIGLPLNRPEGSSPWVMIAPPGTKGGLGLDPSFIPPRDPNPEPTIPPDYLSPAYFDGLKRLLEYAKQDGRKVVFYDEIGFPSGMANHTVPDGLNRQALQKTEESITGPNEYRSTIGGDGALMAVVAMNAATKNRVNLMPFVHEEELKWQAPEGTWQIMVFRSVPTEPSRAGTDYRGAVDYLEPAAVQWFVDTVYEPHAREVREYFGETLYMTFFDDVGIWPEEKTWTPKFNDKFEARFGIDPAIYYPALWYDIGPETAAARYAFFDTRAELLADGFPKVVTDWGAKYNLDVAGHCPGNYDLQPVDMNGDPFKFYRAQPIPMVDVIFGYPHGRDGFKLVSDGAELYDKPIVAAETFAPFVPAGQKDGYRRVMELYARGITRLVGVNEGSGERIGDPDTFTQWAGRSAQMLQNGRRVSELAILYPIGDIQAFYRFDAPEFTKEMRSGSFIPDHTDFAAVGEMLLSEVHRDFTFLHPDVLSSEKVAIDGPILKLNNKVNWQSWRALILPGQELISLAVLEKVKAYYDAGGVVLATSRLPSKAAELAGSDEQALANDRKVQALVKAIFGIDSAAPMPDGVVPVNSNDANGKAVFVREPSSTVLAHTLDELELTADARFYPNPTPSSGGGVFSYVHKVKEHRQIYFFANSSNDEVSTNAEVRGRINPEIWDPLTGAISPVTAEYVLRDGQEYTRFPLNLKAVSAIFIVG